MFSTRIVEPVLFKKTVTSAVSEDISYQFEAVIEKQERCLWFQQDSAELHGRYRWKTQRSDTVFPSDTYERFTEVSKHAMEVEDAHKRIAF